MKQRRIIDQLRSVYPGEWRYDGDSREWRNETEGYYRQVSSRASGGTETRRPQVRYEIVPNDEVRDPSRVGELPDCGWSVVDTSTDPPTWVGCDGGEPEDQLLVRDWSWVVPALNHAYEGGFRAGIEAAAEIMGELESPHWHEAARRVRALTPPIAEGEKTDET